MTKRFRSDDDCAVDIVKKPIQLLCMLNDLHESNIELKDAMKRMAIEMMGG